jgi:geranylgeranyl reductase family protein
MNMATKYDVIIVGGGPAGATAGYVLSDFGLRVLIIDKSKFPRDKPCGGLLSYKTIKFVDRIFNEQDSLRKNNIINFESNHYEVFHKDKLIVRGISDIHFYMVERQIYDTFLLRKAQESGAEVIEGDMVKVVDLSKSEVTTATGKIFKANFIIGADGANSIVRKNFPKERFDKEKWQHDLAMAFEVYVDRVEMKKEINCPILLFDQITWGYSWIFPNKNKLVVGLFGLNRTNKKAFLKSFHNFLSYLKLDKSSIKKLKIKEHPVPYGNFMLNPIFKNTLLVGDAAGFVDPLFGEGIYYAQKSAEHASHAIYKTISKCVNLETTYLQALQKPIYQELIYSKKIRGLLFNYITPHYYPTKIMMNLLKRQIIELVQGIRSYKWLRKIDDENERG